MENTTLRLVHGLVAALHMEELGQAGYSHGHKGMPAARGRLFIPSSS
jgi:hypothetical protein